jgi:NAD(P)-dependent dehydrogenase (short-subunit alcohol dehydrogenase family)/thioester reductase-like protein
VQKLFEREGTIVYFLIREQSLGRVDALRERWGATPDTAIPVIGDLTRPLFGIRVAQRDTLHDKIDHMFHLGAVYDLKASAAAQEAANVDGTRNAVAFAQAVGVKRFHLVSSIAAAGLYEGVFREDMFDEAEHLEHPYFRTKHESEAIVRTHYDGAWRVYRPGIVVGDSRTGEMDKIDGPYYFFKPIQKLRHLFPAWMPAIGIEGGRLNLVPVDFVVDALDAIAHQEGLDRRCFHLTDPNPKRVGEILSLFARAAHAPDIALNVNTRMFGLVPSAVLNGLASLPPVQRVLNQIMEDLALPQGVMTFVNYPTRFDCRATERVLEGTGIKVPPLESYAWKLWDYWERQLDPDLFVERSLHSAIHEKVVMITGAGAGIGRAAALKLARAGAQVVLIDRDVERLDDTRRTISEAGGKATTYTCDLTDYETCDKVVLQVLREHGSVDVLINNAGRSIRRSIEQSYERFHDFERTMRLNYFGALRITLGLLPAMQRAKRGHVINISSIGVLANAPRFAAYVASKAAMDAFARCAASEFADDGIAFTTINMPLVRTSMTAPTKAYESAPMLTPDEAADLIVRAIIDKPERVTTRLGMFAEVLYAVAPKISHVIMNTAYRMFPESGDGLENKEGGVRPDRTAIAELMRGFHL